MTKVPDTRADRRHADGRGCGRRERTFDHRTCRREGGGRPSHILHAGQSRKWYTRSCQFTAWMVISFIAATAMNALFTIDWLKQHDAPIDRSFRLGPLSNYFRALDIAKENGVMPDGLRWQKRFYIQTLLVVY